MSTFWIHELPLLFPFGKCFMQTSYIKWRATDRRFRHNREQFAFSATNNNLFLLGTLRECLPIFPVPVSKYMFSFTPLLSYGTKFPWWNLQLHSDVANYYLPYFLMELSVNRRRRLLRNGENEGQTLFVSAFVSSACLLARDASFRAFSFDLRCLAP